MKPLERQIRQAGVAYRAALKLVRDDGGPESVASQLLVARANIEAALAMIEFTDAPTQCQHPPEKRVDHSTPGTRRYQCTVCGEVVEEAWT